MPGFIKFWTTLPIMDITRAVKNDTSQKQWYLVDAKDQVLGRLCSNIAKILRGKHKPSFTPNADTGDFIIVINSDKIKLTGKKETTKTYSHYSGYPGGLKVHRFREVLSKQPNMIIQNAVKGMLPHNKLGRQMLTKLKIYASEQHPHQAQQPQTVKITKD